MPDFNQWLAQMHALEATHRAILAWRRIQRQPTTITVERDGTTLDPQTVRLEASDNVHSEASPATSGAMRGVVVFGVRGHPHQPDTDLQAGDRFAVGALAYTVLDVVLLVGELQARAVLVS